MFCLMTNFFINTKNMSCLKCLFYLKQLSHILHEKNHTKLQTEDRKILKLPKLISLSCNKSNGKKIINNTKYFCL